LTHAVPLAEERAGLGTRDPHTHTHTDVWEAGSVPPHYTHTHGRRRCMAATCQYTLEVSHTHTHTYTLNNSGLFSQSKRWVEAAGLLSLLMGCSLSPSSWASGLTPW